MTSAFHSLRRRLMGAALAICLCCSIILSPFSSSAQAGRSTMSGDYLSDTLSVAESLQEVISMNKEEEGSKEAEQDAVNLITDYISRYRNRSEINSTVSFTTMQTALNAMAGHYKTFANRPLPEKLKERLNKELNEVEKLVQREA